MDRQLRPGSSVAATTKGAAAEKSPGNVDLAEAQLLGRADGDAAAACASRGTPAASSISSVWSRVGSGSTHGRAAGREQPGEQDARLHLRARHRQLVADPAQLAALDRERRLAVGALDARAHLGERVGDPVDRPAAERLVAVELEAALLAGEDAGEQPQRRARVAAVDRRVRLRAARAGRRRATRSVSTSSSSTVTPSARTAAIVASVSPERPKPRTDVSPSAIAAEQHGAVRDRLVARDGDVAASSGAPARPSFRQHRRDDDAVALRLEQRRRALRFASRRVTRSVSVPPRSGETWWSSKSSMLIRSRAERLRDPGEHARAVGHVDAELVEIARVGERAGEHAAPVVRGLADPAGEEAAVAGLERGLELLDPPPVLGERLAERPALSRKMSTQMRGFAPATRVMSRSEPPAAASGSWPSTRVAPAWLTSRLARACGRWLVSATSRSCASGRSRPGSRRARRRRRGRAGSAPGRSRATGSGTRSRRRRGRPSRARPARLGAGDRVAADEARVAERGRDDAPWSSRRR